MRRILFVLAFVIAAAWTATAADSLCMRMVDEVLVDGTQDIAFGGCEFSKNNLIFSIEDRFTNYVATVDTLITIIDTIGIYYLYNDTILIMVRFPHTTNYINISNIFSP